MDIANMSIDIIPQLSTAMATANVMNQVNVELMSQALDTFEMQGEATIDMMRKSMEMSVNPYAGANFDICI